MACLGIDGPVDMDQSPPICPTDTPGAPACQGAGGWPPSGRRGGGGVPYGEVAGPVAAILLLLIRVKIGPGTGNGIGT